MTETSCIHRRSPSRFAKTRPVSPRENSIRVSTQPKILQYTTLICLVFFSLSIGFLLGGFHHRLPSFLTRSLTTAVTAHHASPPLIHDELISIATEGVDPTTGIPLIPLAADPFMQRVAFAMPQQIFDWAHETPCHMNPDPPFGYAVEEKGAVKLMRLRRSLHGEGGLKRFWSGVEDEVRTTDARNRMTRESVLEVLGFRGWCEGEKDARRVLEAEREAEMEEVGALKRVEDRWGWRRCLWARWGILTGSRPRPVAGRDPGGPIREACENIGDENNLEAFRQRLHKLQSAALGEQHRVLALVAQIADAETTDILSATIIPAIQNCSSYWSSSTRSDCVTHILPSLHIHSHAGNWTRPSWAEDSSDDTGKGETIMIRQPDSVYGVAVPSERTPSRFKSQAYGFVSRRQEVSGLQHDFLNALITEMLAEAVLEVIGTLEEVCDTEVRRGQVWWSSPPLPQQEDIPHPHHPSKHQPQRPAPSRSRGISALFSRALIYLSLIPHPFSSPRHPPQGASFAFQHDRDIFAPLPGRNKRGKSTPREKFFNTAISRRTCLYTAARSGRPTATTVPLSRVPIPEPFSGMALDGGEVEKTLRTAGADVRNAFWAFWGSGVEARWKMVWEARFSGEGRGEARYALDLGGTVGVLGTRSCRGWRREAGLEAE